MNQLLWSWWNKIPDQESFLNRLTKVVVLIWIACALSGAFAAYRLGEYMQAKRIAEQNSVIQSN